MRKRCVASALAWAVLLLTFAMARTLAQAPKSEPQSEPLPNFVQMVASADAIGVARVEKVTWVGDLQIAEAVVLDGIRGLKVGGQFAYLAQRSFLTDDSFAVRGETVLLFLTKYPAGYGADHDFFAAHPRFLAERNRALSGKPLYRIASAGLGRMAVFRAPQGSAIYEPVSLPQSVPVFPFPQAYGTMGHIVRIADMAKLVRKLGHHAPAKSASAPQGGKSYVRNRVGEI